MIDLLDPARAQLMADLASAGVIAANDPAVSAVREKDAPRMVFDGRQHLWLTEAQAEAVRIRPHNPQVNAESYFGRIPQAWKDEWKNKEIVKDDWCPEEADKHTLDKEFRAFIASHIPRFDRIIPYLPFYLYCLQAMRWHLTTPSLSEVRPDERAAFVKEEFRRGRMNPLYWANRYGYIRDDEYPGGWRKYEASTPQALVLFLRDCRFSGELGKGRQAAITSTMMLRRAIVMLTRHSHQAALVTDDVEVTGQRIMSDKLMSSMQYMIRLNPWMSPTDKPNWTPKRMVITWGSKSKAAKKTFSSETILAAASEGQTINGINISEADFDEAQNIKTYRDIKYNARPIMRANINGRLILRRQIWAWGTGNRKHSGGGSFEIEYKTTLSRWKAGEDTSSHVPLFFDWTCRPGITEKDYYDEYKFYMSGRSEGTANSTQEEQFAEFCAAMPNKPDDMFLASTKTIVPSVVIAEAQDLIVKHYHDRGLPIKARMEAEYNTSIPVPEGSYIPFAIQGVRMTPLAPDAVEAPVLIAKMPERGWVSRFYMGTDPIQSSSGTSAFSSAIYDAAGYIQETADRTAFMPTVAAMLNWRPPVIEDAFLQATLLGMYYRNEGQRSCKELIETNAGQAYERFVTGAGVNLSDRLWLRGDLPVQYRGGKHIYGIDMKNATNNSRKSSLFYDIVRFHSDHRVGNGRGLPIVPFFEYWSQLRTVSVEETDRGAIEFGVTNRKLFQDDMIFSVQYAYLSHLCAGRQPEKVGEGPKYHNVMRERINPETLQMYTVMVREPIRYNIHA